MKFLDYLIYYQDLIGMAAVIIFLFAIATLLAYELWRQEVFYKYQKRRLNKSVGNDDKQNT